MTKAITDSTEEKEKPDKEAGQALGRRCASTLWVVSQHALFSFQLNRGKTATSFKLWWKYRLLSSGKIKHDYIIPTEQHLQRQLYPNVFMVPIPALLSVDKWVASDRLLFLASPLGKGK